MSRESNTIELSSRHQLVDLNKNLVNFKLDFQVISPQNKEFETIILNQNEINSYENMDMMKMKKAPGKISGSIIADNNQYKNYFIILKSDEPQTVEVITTIEEIPPKEEEENDLLLNSKTMENEIQIPFYKTRGCWILILLIGLLLIYYFKGSIFKKKATQVEINVNPTKVDLTPNVNNVETPTTAPSIDNVKPLTTKLIQQEN
jgi:hypothetical protein